MEIRWSLPAADDLERICAWIERDNPEAARRVAKVIYDGCSQLKDFPIRSHDPQIFHPYPNSFLHNHLRATPLALQPGFTHSPWYSLIRRGEKPFQWSAAQNSGPFLLCAEHVRQLGGESPLDNLMEVKS